MDQQQQQQQPGYYSQNTMAGSPSRQSPAGTPTHSRNASFGSMTNIQAAAPPLFRNPSSGALQRSSSPSMYGASQPYQVPMPAPTEAQLMSKQQQDWYPRYAVGSPGPPQQASTPGMYTRGYSNSRPGSANANNVAFDNIPEAEYARPGSAGGMMMPPPQSPGRSQQRRYYANGAAAMGPRPYPSAPSQPQQGEWQGIYRDV
ncbi:MAG: COP9 signalosome-like protein complex subunit 4 [Aureobasidium pullulans]|nr:MAG: COP9 signalosome-like protein complex subunit 4 [Aureobasidium pullulans]